MKTNRITESLKKEIASATARKILSELDWSTVNSYASKKQDRDMSRNNKNYGVNNLGDMRNVDDEEYWKRSDDIDAEYASNKKEAERRFIKKHFPNLKPSTENLNKILYAFDYLDVVCDDILHYLPLDENSMDTWKLLLNAYFDFKKHKEQGGYTDEWGE